MSGKSPLEATAEQREALEFQAGVSDREAADRGRGILLSLSGWTSLEIGETLRVREDTVRGWRSAFMRNGLSGIARRVAPGPAPVKADAALVVAREVLGLPVENRTNWTLPRLAAEIETRSGVRLKLLKQQALAGDIVLLFANESEALTQPYLARAYLARAYLARAYLARAWALRGADLRVEAPRP